MKDFLSELSQEPEVEKEPNLNPAYLAWKERFRLASIESRKQAKNLRHEHDITRQTQIQYPRV